MRKARTYVGFVGCFVAGIVLVLACQEVSLGIDAGIDAHANECADCEPPITADRIYRARKATNYPSEWDHVGMSVYCEDGDIVIGGGCWIYPYGAIYDGSSGPDAANYDHEIVLSAPIRYINAVGNETGREEAWMCIYDNREMRTDLIAEANAICFHPATDGEDS